MINCENSVGDMLLSSSNCYQVFSANNVQNAKYSYDPSNTQDIYDLMGV